MTEKIRNLAGRACADLAVAISRDDAAMFANAIRDVLQSADAIAPEIAKRFAVTDAADVVGNDSTLQEQWDAAAGDAHDALFRLVAIQESITERANEIFDDVEADAQSILDLDLDDAKATAEAAEDCTIPDWAV